MTFDELVNIWHGSAEWWLKAEGDSDYFYKGFVSDMTVPTFLKIRNCEIVEEQVLILKLRTPEDLRYWLNMCISIIKKEEASEQSDKKSK